MVPITDPFLQSEAALQLAAADVWCDLDLETRLSTLGVIHRVGAQALGVMVSRDIDVTIAVPTLDDVRKPLEELRSTLSAHPKVTSVTFRDDSGNHNVEPDLYPDGLLLQVTYAREDPWTLDLWFVEEPERQPDIAHVASMRPRLTDTVRSTIVQIKTAMAQHPAYGKDFGGFDIYRAVLQRGITSAEEFMSWRGIQP